MDVSAFYYLSYPETDEDEGGVAYGEDRRELDALLADPAPVTNWPTLQLTLRDGVFQDLQADNLGLKLCSERLRAAVESASVPEDGLEWLPVSITDPASGETRQYFALHALHHRWEVLDPERSIMAAPDSVVKAVLRREEASKYRVLVVPGGSFRFCVAEEVRKAVKKAKCTGVGFSKVAMT